ncbi:pentatricopeptide repeat-containing protein At1g06710, mitochondrial [Glycine soja]|uniref:Pentatricopeptide repeat-containing protein, mitochondrial isoform A n=1 Tax=Glycine soja TaxID=3848 RepID=A0A445HVC0_GLYSO|nr:pentatricopeptide repeat-containing protein At1g06710, mitochondrial [Glycine soja]XP_028191371.1 pentatricopeptide repeat-containing protein At1g06710, mitochondrial [Glycine soja]XP_028191372.1 pentatricopeptide repeat-containing protein At1g06710, mitochondrial [Glycine soja]KHN35153.1 Pentatricopeptide repeat-containing protein, mitochondrial [Glycine soja]RZB77696.1 Pentatricopeptide repeat-containing protein, mitochondrial isoform A [Glycine soja]RZB77697.1 Pentatricopeptide repeat-co
MRKRELNSLASRSLQFLKPKPFSTSSSHHPLPGLLPPEETSPLDSSPDLSQHYAFLRTSLLNSATTQTSNDALSISNAIRTGFGAETQNFLRQFRGRLSEPLVVEVMNLVKHPEFCVEFFLWASRQIGYSHTPVVYNALIELLCCNAVNNDRVSHKFLMQIRDDDRELLRKLLNFLIQKCCRNGMWNVALEELGRLKDFGYKASPTTYNALIQVFLRADKLDTAFLVHREMSNSGFRMDGCTLGCFAYSLCKAGRCGDALSLIEKEEFVPDTVFYNRMVSGLCEASLFQEAMDILDRMRSISCIPNVVTYRILLSGCLGKGQLGRCKRILSMMMTEGCYPNREMFNTLVHAYCKSRDYSYAYKLFKKMIKCGCQPGYLLYNIFIGSICSNEELPGSDLLELAEKAYSEMLDLGVVLNKVNVSNFARCLCGAGKFDKAFEIICEMMSKGFVPDDSTYSKVIGFLCDASKVEKAFLLFEEMKKNGIVPSVYTYTILIDSFCKAGLIQQARNWFDEMLRDSCTPNVVTYTSLIHAYLKARKVFDANKLFEMMLLEGCKPNVVTYTALIDGHCKAGQIDKACQIYARMQGDIESSDIDMYFKLDDNDCETPNIITYGALVDGLCKANRVEEARELLDTMSVNGCEPNQIVYDALIDGFCKTGKLENAQEVFVKMSERGYCPNLYTYSSLINSLFKEKRLDLVLKVLSKMLENSCTPNVVIYTDMIDGLCKVGKTEEAYRLMLKMEEVGCYPNVITYTAMIDGFGKIGKIEQCLELYRDMCSKGCAPNFITYRVLINHCCSTGLLDEAHRLLDEMKQTYWPRHISSYRKIIEGFNREFITSIGLLDELSENESVPVESLYRILIDNFIKAGRLEGALNLLEEISSSPSLAVANKYLYTSLIESLSHASKVDKAFELYASMINKNMVPELSTFVHLIKGLTRVGKWQEALQLSDSICQMDIHWLHEEVPMRISF